MIDRERKGTVATQVNWRAFGLATMIAALLVGVGCSNDAEVKSVGDDPTGRSEAVAWSSVFVLPTADGIVALGGVRGGISRGDDEEHAATFRMEAKAYWARGGEIVAVGDLPVGDGRAFAASAGVNLDGSVFAAGVSCVPNDTEAPGCQAGTLEPVILRGDVSSRSWTTIDPPADFKAVGPLSLDVVDGQVLLSASTRSEPPKSIDFSGQEWSIQQLDQQSMRWSPVASPPPISDGIAAVMPQMCATGSSLIAVSPAPNETASLATWAAGRDGWTLAVLIPDRNGAFPPVPACGPDRIALMVPERETTVIQSLDASGGSIGTPTDIVSLPVLASGVKVAVNTEGAVLVATQESVAIYRADGALLPVKLQADQVRRLIPSGGDFIVHSNSGVASVDGRTGEITQEA